MAKITYIREEDSSSSELPAVERKAAEEATYAFLMAVRNYALFPPEHASTRNMLAGLTLTINNFTKTYGELRLEIEKNRILYDDEKIYEELDPDENPAFIFFRDGIRILEFLEGMESRELVAFFKIVDHFKIITEEPDGDLVTDLWSADLEHINYEASDELWEAEPVLEFSLLNPMASEYLSKAKGLAVKGFDMLKSMLGIDIEPKDVDKEKETGGEGSKSGAPGTGEEGLGDLEVHGLEMEKDAGGEVNGAAGGGDGEFGGDTDGGSAGEPGQGGTGDGGLYAEPDFWGALVGLDGDGEGIAGGGVPGSGTGPGTSPGQKKKTPAGSRGKAVRGGKAESVRQNVSSHKQRPGAPSRLSQRAGDADAPPDEEYIGVTIASVEPGHTLWDFTPEEQRTLEYMVKEYEEQSNNANAVEFLMILLKDEEEKHIFESIIGFMRDEFRNILAERDFRLGYILLSNIKEIQEQLPEDKVWAEPILKQYFDDIADAEILDALVPMWPEIHTFDKNLLKALASLLQLMPPRAGEAIASFISEIEPGPGRRIAIDLIASFVSRDLKILDQLLARPEEDLAQRLVMVLADMQDEARAEMMLYKVIGHPKEVVRKKALEILLSRESEYFEKLFKLVQDPSAEIRTTILNYLSGFRSKVLEKLFLDYMSGDIFQKQERDHLAACYKVLGKCGSDFAVEKLEKILFGQPWNFVSGFGVPVHRQGAAGALAAIKTPASLKALNKAEDSSVPHINKAWKLATGN